MRRLIGCALLGLVACAAAATESFDINALQPTVEADQRVLTGWFQIGERFREFRLYPDERDLGKTGEAVCISGTALSLAGIPTPDFNKRRMTITGSIHRADGPEAGATRDVCGAGLIMLAMDISVPE